MSLLFAKIAVHLKIDLIIKLVDFFINVCNSINQTAILALSLGHKTDV